MIPFNRPYLSPRILDNVSEVLRTGHIAGDGPYTERCAQWLGELHEGRKILLTPSCTAALELAAATLGIGPGDEIIVPSFSFVSCASAFVNRGAKIVFADVDPDTLNLDLQDIRGKASSRLRGVVPIHYGGIANRIDELARWCEGQGVALIEDNAHGLQGRWQGQALGCFGRVSVLSFHGTKNHSCGEGGALLLRDMSDYQRAEALWALGTNKRAFGRGDSAHYEWVALGSSYPLSEVLAAMLWAQLQDSHVIQQRRRTIWNQYQTDLADWAESNQVRRPVVPDGCSPAWHIYYLIFPSNAARNLAIARLRDEQIQVQFHYLPLHLSLIGKSLGGKQGDCPVSESVSERILRLPLYPDLSEGERLRIIDAVRKLCL